MHDIEIRRPVAEHWTAMLAVLESRNFHHIGSVEMPEFPLSDCLIALVDGEVRGVGGWRILSETEAKTTLLAVHPDWAFLGLGLKLQSARLQVMKGMGIKSVTTNTDDPRVVRWLEKRHGFVRTGETVPKEADFGNSDVTHWTTLRVEWA